VRARVPADVAGSLAALASLAVATGLTGVRGHVHPEVVAVALAVVVAAAARVGGRVAGSTAALVSALSFDFFHTRPYLSLKIDNTTDLLVMVLLLVVGLVVTL
jgi:K+-sensing histidine kinase KdpD